MELNTNKFYKVKYEVVYISIADPAENADGRGPPTLLDLTTQITNPYIAGQQSYTVLYPNSSENMIKQLTDGIGYYDQSSLPPWMISNQPDPTSVSKFRAPLGYTKAVVLAYTKPGASKLIAYRLKQEGITFNNIEFTVDRYLVDNYYTTNFDLTSIAFSIISGLRDSYSFMIDTFSSMTASTSNRIGISTISLFSSTTSLISSAAMS